MRKPNDCDFRSVPHLARPVALQAASLPRASRFFFRSSSPHSNTTLQRLPPVQRYPLAEPTALKTPPLEPSHPNKPYQPPRSSNTMKRDNNKTSSRGSKRRPGATRTDRDGDISMDARPQNTNRIGKASSRGGPSRSNGRPTVNTHALQRELSKQTNNGASSIARSSRPAQSPASTIKVQFRITGFKASKASINEDGGVGSLVAFLEKKVTFNMQKNAKSRGFAPPEPVKIKRYITESPDSLLVTVTSLESPYLRRLDGWIFAGKPLKIVPADKDSPEPEQPGSSSAELMAVFLKVLDRRYSTENKLLDLSAIGQDPDLVNLGIFNTASTTNKCFPALMKTLDKQFKTATEKREAIQSILLQNNQLSDLKAISSLAATLPDLKNLDLSNNNISQLADLDPLRRKLRKLDHLILSTNPLEQAVPNWHEEVIRWFPTLRFLNTIQIRSDEEAAAAAAKANPPPRGGIGNPGRPPVAGEDSTVASMEWEEL
ncbi:hypothetical protein BKA80DRAFT_273371 [Phyllosticta citrichinensis]